MKKTVLFITREIVPFYYGGIGSQFKAMANLLVSAGFEVSFLTQQHPAFDDKQFVENYPGCSVSFVDTPRRDSRVNFSGSGGLVSHFNLSYASAVCHAFDSLYDQHHFTWVVSADFGAETFFCFLRKQAGSYAKSIFSLFIEGSTHDSLKTYESELPEGIASELDDPQNRLTCSMENICVCLADSIVVPTNITWQQTRQRLGLDDAAHIIPNLVGPEFLKDETTSNDRQLTKTLLFVGRLDHHKGADILLQSFIIKYDRAEDVEIPTLRFVGRDTFCKKYGMTFLEYWRKRIPSHLKQHIDFTGQIAPKTVKKLLEGATLCVFPSRWEVFGIVCLEAMASGCPVVVSSHTGLSEVTGDNFQEYTLDFSRNSMELFDRADRLFLMEPESYRAMCNSFRQRAVEVVEYGNMTLLEYFRADEPAGLNVTPGESQAKNFSGDAMECLSAVCDISSILAHDFNTITALYGLNEDSVKKMICPERYAESSGKNKRFRITRKFARFLLQQIVKFTH